MSETLAARAYKPMYGPPYEAVHDVLELIRVVARKDGRGVSPLVDVILIADGSRNAFEAHERGILSQIPITFGLNFLERWLSLENCCKDAEILCQKTRKPDSLSGLLQECLGSTQMTSVLAPDLTLCLVRTTFSLHGKVRRLL
jgi:hypothetical protein